jgi:DNA-binding transcriptional MerR regulator/methylmalonyl-CoA mutase cobalamin-binding subunit
MARKTEAALYPIRAAARLTQLSIETLRAWEKRYKAVEPVRRKGIRLYSDSDIERLSLLRRAIQHGHSIGQASRLSNKELLSLRDAVTASRVAEANDLPIERILAAIDEFHYAAADRELGRLASLMPPRDLIHKIALPLMRIVGERWHEQRVRVAQEHLISQLVSNLLGGIVRIYAPVHPPAVLMTTTLSDDLHEFGVLAAAILAAGAGLGVVHLGPNLPVDEIVYAAKRSRTDVVLLSVTNPQDRALRQEQLRSLRRGLPKEKELWVGVNPPNTRFDVGEIRILGDFGELEREIQRIGGRF